MAKDDKKKDAGKAGKGGAPTVVQMWVSRSRTATALLGFLIVTFVSKGAGMDLTGAALHGLVGAVIFSFVGWFCALLVLTGLMRTAARNSVPGPPRPAPVPRAGTSRASAGGQEALPPSTGS
jgi:hypothetical protein